MLLEKRHEFKPFEYPELEAMWLKIQQTYWIHNSIDFSTDVQNFRVDLDEKERYIVGTILKSFTQCYDQETEILTSDGWILFENLKDEKIAQFLDGTITFVKPSNYFKKEYNGLMRVYKDSLRRIDLKVTPNHRMVVKKYTGEYEIKEDHNFTFTQDWYHLKGGMSPTGEYTLTPNERVWIAYQADGNTKRYNGKNTGRIVNKISFKKPNKIERFRNLLTDSDYSFYEKIDKRGYTQFDIYTSPGEVIPKTFDWVKLSNISYEWCREFINELSYWDCHVSKSDDSIVYGSNIKQNTDIVQAIVTLSGYYSSGLYPSKKKGYKDVHMIRIQPNAKPQNNGQMMNRNSYYESYNGFIYCVTVPSGAVVVRRNDVVSVSGNTEVFVFEDFWAKVGTYLPKPEIAVLGAVFSENEVRHALAYARLNDVLGLSDFKAFMSDPVLTSRFANLTSVFPAQDGSYDVRDIILTLAIFGCFTEYVNLFSQFAVLKSFSANGRNFLPNIGTIIDYSALDEDKHARAAIYLVNLLKTEYPESWDAGIQTKILESADTILNIELKLIDQIFEKGDLVNLSKQELVNFMKNRINESLELIGLDPVHEINTELLKSMSWFLDNIFAKQHSDFFYRKPTAYTKNKTPFDRSSVMLSPEEINEL